MATNSLHYTIQHHHSLAKRHHPSDTPPPITSLFLKHPIHPNITLSHTTPSNSHIIFSSLSQTTPSSTTTSPATTTSFDLLRDHLSSQDFRLADEETRRLLIVLAGEAAQKRGYVFFSEVKFISESDLRALDALWREYSGGKFGYSVQKKLLEKANGDFTKFFIKVGWMKKLDTEVEQYNYRSFPTEFIWELNDDTPEGHLPLTNALRGTQLINNVLNHPAFDAAAVVDNNNKEEQDDADEKKDNGTTLATGFKDNSNGSSRILKPDYSF